MSLKIDANQAINLSGNEPANGSEVKSAPSPTPYYVRALVMGIPAYLIGVHLWTWVFTLPIFLKGEADFRPFYTAGYMVRTGQAAKLHDYLAQYQLQNQIVSQGDIALPFIHPAYEALFFAPLSYLSYRTGYLVFLALNVALLCLVYRLMRPWMANLARIYAWLPAALFLAFLPIAAALIKGQDSVLLLASIAGAWVYLSRDREFPAGILLGLALFKFQVVLPIAFLFLVWRRWRFFSGFAFSGGVVTLLTIWLLGMKGAFLYARSLFVMSVSTSGIHQFIYAIYPRAMPNLYGLVFGLTDPWLPTFWIQATTLLVSAVFLCIVIVWGLKGKSDSNLFLVAVTCSTLLSYHLFIHDLSVLLIPLLVTLDKFMEAEATGDANGRLLTRAAAVMFVAPLCESYIPGHFFVVCLPLCFFLYTLMTRDQCVNNCTHKAAGTVAKGIASKCQRVPELSSEAS
jgi:glycosyl transferase family 87